jgi:hypothetical protein
VISMHAFYRGERDPDTSKFFSKVIACFAC